MKATDAFKRTIETHLQKMAAVDTLFAANLAKPAKNLDDCITYILNQVKASGRNGFTDDEIYGMAAHYYDEDDLKPGEPVNVQRVVVNHVPELTEAEKAEAKRLALEKLADEQRKLMAKPKAKPEPVATTEVQTSLF